MRADQRLTSVAWQRDGRDVGRAALTGEAVTIGRATGNVLVIDVDAVSKHHLRLERASGGWQARDVGSSNGTLLNGQPLRDGSLVRAGDRLTIGAEDVVVVGEVRATRRRVAPLAAVRAVAGACAIVLLGTFVARSSERGGATPDRSGQRGTTAGVAASGSTPAQAPARIVDEVRARAEAAHVNVTTALLQEAQRARWVGRLRDAMELATAALARDPESRAARLLTRRIDQDRRARAAQLQREAALADAIHDETAASAYLRQLVDLLDADDPAGLRAAASIERQAHSSAGAQRPQGTK